MNKYPMVEINKEKMKHNLKYTCDLLHKQNKTLSLVCKGVCSNKLIMDNIVRNSDCDYLATSRVMDAKRMSVYKKPIFLIRSSMKCEIKDIIKYCDISFESSIETLSILNKEAKKQNKTHEIVLAIDLGDLREGIFYTHEDEIYEFIDYLYKCSNLSFKGIGTNLGCLNRIQTNSKNLSMLVSVKEKIEKHYNIKINFVSGLNSASYPMIEHSEIPCEINNARIGEAWLMGHDGVLDLNLDNLYRDTLIFKAQVIEVKNKPSLPLGEISPIANVKINDKGIIKRAIIACGHQEIDIENIIPLDSDIKILGCSSDHTVLDITDCKKQYKVGDIISLIPKYKSMLRMFSSNYVHKKLV